MAAIDRKQPTKTLPVGLRSPSKPPSATKPPPVVALRKRLGLPQAEFARMIPVSLRTLATLERGTTPSAPVARRLTELSRLAKTLSEVIPSPALGDWLKSPNPVFEGLKPLEVIERGESDRIWGMIYFLQSGVPS